MAKLLSRSRIEVSEYYRLLYSFVDDPQSGFMFPCDKDGNVNLAELSECCRDSYERCLNNTHSRPVVRDGVHTFRSSYQVPAELECDCKRIVHLSDPMTNVCECGRLYNGSGQALASPALWGEETGERFDRHGQLIR